MSFLKEHLLISPGGITSPVACCLSTLLTPASPAVKYQCKQLLVMLRGELVCSFKQESLLLPTRWIQYKGFAWRHIFTRYRILRWCIVEVYCVLLPIDMYICGSSSQDWSCCSISLLRRCSLSRAITEDEERRIYDLFSATETITWCSDSVHRMKFAGIKDFPFVTLSSR